MELFPVDWSPFRVMTVVEGTAGNFVVQGLYVIVESDIHEEVRFTRTLNSGGKFVPDFVESSVTISLMHAEVFDDFVQLDAPVWTIPNDYFGYFNVNGLGYYMQSVEQRFEIVVSSYPYASITARIVRSPDKDARPEKT